ncbi:MAG: DnaD domain protein [Chloroflexaceae bacterium]|nr:DnaD domain protein [Chloroflexaceae bacterium]NJO04274.1 DnaD domain protein [Chloroflexaceae bacterium]
MTFTGFSTDRLISLPPEWFTDVLPAITLPSELKVTLHMFYRLSQQRGSPRRMSWDELAQDDLLLRGLRSLSKLRPPAELLEEGLHAAVQRTTLLLLALPGEGRVVNWYLVHTPANRAWVEQMQQVPQSLAPNAPYPAQSPSLVTLYEQNIGIITPLMVEELREAEERYPRDWIEEAMREAVRANIRSWRYIRKVLERWASDGRQAQPEAYQSQRSTLDVERYVNSSKYRHLFRQGGDDDNDT